MAGVTKVLTSIPKKSSRPSFQTMKNYYPKTLNNVGYFSRVLDGHFGVDTYVSRSELLNSRFPNAGWENTCALRISVMLNKAPEHRINFLFKNDYHVIKNGMVDYNQKSYEGNDGNIYIPGTNCMGAYLSWVYGRPDYHALKHKRTSSDKTIPPELKEIDGGKGIILHLRMGYGGGHIDLWDGTQCYGNQTTYFGTALEIYYWKLAE